MTICFFFCSVLRTDVYSCSASWSWRYRVVDVMIDVRGRIEDLLHVHKALRGCHARELLLTTIVPPYQPMSLQLPSYSPASVLPSNKVQPLSETRPLSPDPDETRPLSPDPDDTRPLLLNPYIPKLFDSKQNFSPELFSSPSSPATPLFSIVPPPLHCSTPVSSHSLCPIRNLFPPTSAGSSPLV